MIVQLGAFLRTTLPRGLDARADYESGRARCRLGSLGYPHGRRDVSMCDDLLGFQLDPKPGHSPLSPDEIIGRIRDTFRHVTIDREAGRDYVTRLAEGIAQITWPASVSNEQSRTAQRLRADSERAVRVTFWDVDSVAPAPEQLLTTVLGIGARIDFDFVDASHEDYALPLLRRLEDVLGYEGTRVYTPVPSP